MFTSKECIKWVKTEMETNSIYNTVYEWNMLLSILKNLERKEELEKENQELKERQKDILNANVELSFDNHKLKNAIEILKNKKILPFTRNLLIDNEEVISYHLTSEYNVYNLTQQEYELLKEVLG